MAYFLLKYNCFTDSCSKCHSKCFFWRFGANIDYLFKSKLVFVLSHIKLHFEKSLLNETLIVSTVFLSLLLNKYRADKPIWLSQVSYFSALVSQDKLSCSSYSFHLRIKNALFVDFGQFGLLSFVNNQWKLFRIQFHRNTLFLWFHLQFGSHQWIQSTSLHETKVIQNWLFWYKSLRISLPCS